MQRCAKYMNNINKIKFLFLFLIFTVVSYSEVKVSVFENMKFQQMSTRNMRRAVLGKGILEIYADKEDFGKIVELTFVKKSIMTNGKNPILVEKLSIEDKYERFEIKSKVTRINFYGIINKKKIMKSGKPAEVIEGDYIGGIPIRVSIYDGENTSVPNTETDEIKNENISSDKNMQKMRKMDRRKGR